MEGMHRSTLSDIESTGDQDDTPSNSQPPLSPAGGAESLFLAGLAASEISAESLSIKLRQAKRYPGNSFGSRSAVSVQSVLTDDFQSCAEFSDDPDHFPITDDDDEDPDDDTTFFSLFSPKKSPRNMAKSKSSATTPMSTTTTTKPAPQSVKEGMDVADHVYEKAKDVWAWGKGVPLVGFGLGITEAIAGKAVSIVGTDFEKIDKELKPQLAHLDHDIFNPVIEKVVTIFLGAAGKTEQVMKPIVIKILSPFGLIKNEAENPELTK